jgi:hypothetical protein
VLLGLKTQTEPVFKTSCCFKNISIDKFRRMEIVSVNIVMLCSLLSTQDLVMQPLFGYAWFCSERSDLTGFDFL